MIPCPKCDRTFKTARAMTVHDGRAHPAAAAPPPPPPPAPAPPAVSVRMTFRVDPGLRHDFEEKAKQRYAHQRSHAVPIAMAEAMARWIEATP